YGRKHWESCRSRTLRLSRCYTSRRVSTWVAISSSHEHEVDMINEPPYVNLLRDSKGSVTNIVGSQFNLLKYIAKGMNFHIHFVQRTDDENAIPSSLPIVYHRSHVPLGLTSHTIGPTCTIGPTIVHGKTASGSVLPALPIVYPRSHVYHWAYSHPCALQGLLAQQIQQPGESVLSFATKIRDLGNQILQTKKLTLATGAAIPKDFEENVKGSQEECFRKGLLDNISVRMKSIGGLTDIIKEAITIEKDLEVKSMMMRRKLEKRCGNCGRTNHATEQCRGLMHCMDGNIAYFIDDQGQPVDEGARKLHEFNKLPKFSNISIGEVSLETNCRLLASPRQRQRRKSHGNRVPIVFKHTSNTSKV
ncbi:unnamed protein product, partial [Trichogramma brassicae]